MTQEPVVGKNVTRASTHRDTYYCRTFLEWKQLGASLSVPLIPSPGSFCHSLPVSLSVRPRRPRHAQQTSPTARSGRHAAFIMFPRSSFDGSNCRGGPSTAGGKQGQWTARRRPFEPAAREKPPPIYDCLRSFRFDFQPTPYLRFFPSRNARLLRRKHERWTPETTHARCHS